MRARIRLTIDFDSKDFDPEQCNAHEAAKATLGRVIKLLADERMSIVEDPIVTTISDGKHFIP